MLVENLLGMWTMELLPLVHADPRVLSDVLTGKYNQLEEWMNNNKLVINPDKTHLMVIGSDKATRIRQQVNIMAGEYCIKPTETEKLLGGHIHQSLKSKQEFKAQY